MEWMGATALYLALALLATWPVCTKWRHLVPGGAGDPVLNLWILAWDLRHLNAMNFSNYWNGAFFYPTPGVMGLQENLLTLGALGLPLFDGTHSLIATYNGLLILAFVMAGLAAFFLVRALTASFSAALVAGAIFAFNPHRFTQLGHLQLLTTAPIPLAFLAAHALAGDLDAGAAAARSGRGMARQAVAALALAAAMISAALTSCYHGLYLALFVGMFWIWKAPRRPRPAGWALLSALVVAITLRPVYRHYTRAPAAELQRSLATVVRTSPDPDAFLRAAPENWMYGRSLRPGHEAPWKEDRLFPGLVSVALALGGIFLGGLPRPGEPRRFYLAMAIMGGLLALGPVLSIGARPVPLPYMGLYRALPIFRQLRFPGRFMFYVMLALAVLSGFGVVALRRLLGRNVGRGLVVLLLILVTGEAIHLPLTGIELPGRSNLPPVYRWLERAPDGPVLELPLAEPEWDADALYVYFATFHRKPLVNGYAAAAPAAFEAQARALARPPDPTWSHAVLETGARFVVLHGAAYRAGEAQARLLRLEEDLHPGTVVNFGADTVIELGRRQGGQRARPGAGASRDESPAAGAGRERPSSRASSRAGW